MPYDAYLCKMFTYLCRNAISTFAEAFRILTSRPMKKIMNEKLTISTSHPVRARFYDYPRFTYPWHFHREYEIIYVEEGEGDCLVGDRMAPYSEGQLILFGSELPHSMQSPSHYGEEHEFRVKGVNVQFEKDFMHYSISQYSQFIPIRDLLEEAYRGIRFAADCSGKAVGLLKQIPSAKGAEQIILLLSLLQVLATDSGRSYLTTSHYTPPSPLVMRNERMERIIAYLNKHYTEPIRLDEIASYTAMCPTAFCRYFKENTGKTFKEYVFEMRVEFACKLLSNSDMNVSRISADCGFESSVHFNRIFKRVTGLTPTTYREQIQR